MLSTRRLSHVVFDVAYGSIVPDLVDPARCFVEVGKQDALARSLTRRIGEEAAAAGGIPFDSQSAQEATACSNGDYSACLSLGKRAADMGVPLGGVPNATDNLSGCKMGDLSACSQLGQALAALPR